MKYSLIFLIFILIIFIYFFENKEHFELLKEQADKYFNPSLDKK